jgi:DeoR family ulaG and ulaABCDEF operon transcriptional repressor
VLEAERQKLILKLVQERSIVSVADLVQLLDSSDATIRRDINAMGERGQIRRIRGGAEAVRPRHEAHLVGTPFAFSQDQHAPQKRAIARAAAALIEDGESIIISGGTTTFALVEFLAQRSLDILSNSIPIVQQLLTASRNQVTIAGGTVFREQNIVLSPFQNDTIEHFWAQKMFIGCYGMNRFGLMEADPLIGQSHARLLGRTEKLVVMADSGKLRRRSSMIVVPLERVTTLVTDEGAEDEDLAVFRQAGIEVITATVETQEMREELS